MKTILRVREDEALPSHVQDIRLIATELEPYGSGTASRRVYVLLATDGRYWLSNAEKLADPLRPIAGANA